MTSQSKAAYASGDGASAKTLSNEGKSHGARMAAYNKQASDYIFRENNSTGRVASDTIDLHGQFVEEAEEILEQRIRYAKDHGQTHLHVIVGKGNHSVDHVQKIKPRVEQVCRELGLQFATEENAGRMYINLTGGAADMPSYENSNHHGGQHQQHGGQQQGGAWAGAGQTGGHAGQQQQQYGGGQQQQQQQYGGQQQQGQGSNDEVEKLVKKFMPRVLRYLKKIFCS